MRICTSRGCSAELIQFTELMRVPQGERGRRRARPDRYHDAGREAAVDRAHDVPEDVRAYVRDHPDAGRRRPRRSPVLRRVRRADGRGGAHLLRGSERRCALPGQTVPSRLRRRRVVVLRAPAALRALLLWRPGAARRRALNYLRQGPAHPAHRAAAGGSRKLRVQRPGIEKGANADTESQRRLPTLLDVKGLAYMRTGSSNPSPSSGESANFRFLASINPPESYRAAAARRALALA